MCLSVILFIVCTIRTRTDKQSLTHRALYVTLFPSPLQQQQVKGRQIFSHDQKEDEGNL